MILVILAICIALIVIGAIIMNDYDYEEAGGALVAIGSVIGVVALIAIVGLSITLGSIYGIDQKIEMYEAQNAQIEESVAIAVEKYMQHEGDIMTEVAPDSAITLVSLYPELKSDTLIEKQIEVYVSNNNKIVELKEKRITAPLLKWWLYFGK